MRMISLCVKNTTLGFERFFFALLFLSERVALRTVRGGLLPAFFGHCNFLYRCLGGGDACTCVTHGIAVFTLISSFLLAF